MTRTEYITRALRWDQDVTGARIEEGINQNRKGDFSLRVVDEEERPVSGVHLSLSQRNHTFLHGANLFMLDELETEQKNAAYRAAFPKICNLATLPFYWSDLEPEPGKPRFGVNSPRVYRRPAPDLCLNYCDEYSLTPKLHCLNYDQWTPRWVPGSVPEIKRLLEKRIAEIANRYAGRIHGMEVVNEAQLPPVHGADRASTPFFGEDDFVAWSFQCARKYLPHNELIINEATDDAWNTNRGDRSWYALSIRDALNKGASIDAIGLQFHMFYRRRDEQKCACPFYSASRLLDTMDTYRRLFHLPLQVTEVTIPAYSASKTNEAIQAAILERLYSVWFSHPSVEAVVYWNLVDGYAAFAPQGDMTSGENYYYGGLMRFDLTPKPAYHMLQELFEHRWRTEASAESDGQGMACVRGFLGEYDVKAEKNGHTVCARLSLNVPGAQGVVRLNG